MPIDTVTRNREANLFSLGYLEPRARDSCGRCQHSIPKQNGMLACKLVKPSPAVSKHGICLRFER